MATLAEKIIELRGSQSYVDFSVKTGVNRQTLRDVEFGVPIRLDTMRQIAQACGVTTDAWIEMLVMWIRSAVGEEEFQKLDVRAASKGGDSKSTLLESFSRASLTHQNLILKALAFPQVLDCVAYVTNMFDSGKAETKDSAAPTTPQDEKPAKTDEGTKVEPKAKQDDAPGIVDRVMQGVSSLIPSFQPAQPAPKKRSTRKPSPRKRAKKILQKK